MYKFAKKGRSYKELPGVEPRHGHGTPSESPDSSDFTAEHSTPAVCAVATRTMGLTSSAGIMFPHFYEIDGIYLESIMRS